MDTLRKLIAALLIAMLSLFAAGCGGEDGEGGDDGGVEQEDDGEGDDD